jgi:hypothetical protein
LGIDAPVNYKNAGLKGVVKILEEQLEKAEDEQLFREGLLEQLGGKLESDDKGGHKIILPDGSELPVHINQATGVLDLKSKHVVEDAIKKITERHAAQLGIKERDEAHAPAEPIAKEVSNVATEVLGGSPGIDVKQRSLVVHQGDRYEVKATPSTVVGGIGEERLKHKANLYNIMWYAVSLKAAAKDEVLETSFDDRAEVNKLFAKELGINPVRASLFFNTDDDKQPALQNTADADRLYKKLGAYIKDSCKENSKLVYAALNDGIISNCKEEVLASRLGKSNEGKCSKNDVVNKFADILAETAQDSLSELLKCTLFTARSSKVWSRE